MNASSRNTSEITYLVLIIFILTASLEIKSQGDIYIASTEKCGACKVLMEKLSKKGIEYKEFRLPPPVLDSYLNQLSDYVNGYPTTFIDLNKNYYLDSNEPYARGLYMGECIIEIYKGTHKTLSRDDYISFGLSANEFFARAGNLIASDKSDITRNYFENIIVDGIKYSMETNISDRTVTISCEPTGCVYELKYVFRIEKFNEHIYTSFYREFPARKSIDTEVSHSLLEYLKKYIFELFDKIDRPR